MSKKEKQEFKDDGRIIADMSEVERNGLFNIFSNRKVPKKPVQNMQTFEKAELTKEEQKAMMKAAYAFAFKIGLIGVGILFSCYFIMWLFLKFA